MRVLTPRLFPLFIVALARPAVTLAQGQFPSAPPDRRYWGVSAEVGAAEVNARPLNAFFAAHTSARIPAEGGAITLRLLLSNPVFGYGSVYYQQAQFEPVLRSVGPTFSLQQHTVGFELHKVLVDKKIQLVLPQLGMGYRLLNLTHQSDAAAPGARLDSLFQVPGAVTLRAQQLVLTGGASIYYGTSWFQRAGIGGLGFGLVGTYSYTVRRGDWGLFGTRTAVPVPPARLDYYALLLSARLVLPR